MLEDIKIKEVTDICNLDGQINSPTDRSDDELKLRELLCHRAQELAKPEKKMPSQNHQLFLRLQIGQEHYGISYQHLSAITKAQSITRVPLTPNFMAGVINYHSNIVTVIDLKPLFHIEGQNLGDWIIIVNSLKLCIGILADGIIGNDHFDPEALTQPISSINIPKLEYILGIYRGEVTVLNIASILSDLITKFSWRP